MAEKISALKLNIQRYWPSWVTACPRNTQRSPRKQVETIRLKSSGNSHGISPSAEYQAASGYRTSRPRHSALLSVFASFAGPWKAFNGNAFLTFWQVSVEVVLLNYTKNPDRICAAAAQSCYSGRARQNSSNPRRMRKRREDQEGRGHGPPVRR